MRVRDVIGQCF